MDKTLNDRIADAEKFNPAPATTPPVVDQSSQAAFGLDWAQRQQQRPLAPADPPKLTPIVPLAN
jgi:hypothetical protein